MLRGSSRWFVAAFSKAFCVPAIVFLIAGAAAGARVPVAQELRDPYFADVPFERWQAEGKRKQIRWDVEFFPVELSVHQRLLERVRIEIDRDPALEPSPRPLAVLVEYRDETGRVWQTHILPGAGRRDGDPAPLETVVFGNAFLLPGEYTISVAAFDAQTLEHSFVSKKIRAKAPSNDPLPDAWDGLPAVEFLPPRADAPDEWFLPTITSRMALPVATRRPVRLDIFLNATPGGNTAGSVTALRRNMGVLIPSLKVLSQIEPQQGSVNVRMLDLVTRRVYRQDDVHTLDWPKLRRVFIENRPGIIDAGALALFWQMRSFFWNQVIADPGPPRGEARVVVVLSGPAFFQGQESLPEAGSLMEREGCVIFYVRYRPVEFFARRPRVHPGTGPFPQRPPVRPLPDDDLETVARKLNAHVFDVTSPGEFRRVLAAILREAARL